MEGIGMDQAIDVLKALLVLLVCVHILVISYVVGFAWKKDKSMFANYKKAVRTTIWLVVRFVKPLTPRI